MIESLQDRCAHCGESCAASAAFCESCGAAISAAAETPGPTPAETPAGTPFDTQAETLAQTAAQAPVETTVETQPNPTLRICADCGGIVAPDGYCNECGTKARSERDRWSEQPVDWVAAVCDRGIRHHRNEDAVAIVALPESGAYAALIVCDGVSTSSNSDVASLRAAHAARDVLGSLSIPIDASVAARIVAITSAIEGAVKAAQGAASATVVTETGPTASSPACTFVTAVVDRAVLVTGWVGDSRAYWLPDGMAPELLSIDHSVATDLIRNGMSREAAEASADAHAITRWLGIDSSNAVPQCSTTIVGATGWLLVCSDGLWNYCSEPTDMAALVASIVANIEVAGVPTDMSTISVDPLPVANELVAWANAQGGHDNISVVLARIPAPTC